VTSDGDGVRAVLARYQELYRARDPALLDEAMGLFVPGIEPEMVGTEAVLRGDPDWAGGLEEVRTITAWDWEFWWDVELDVADARITVEGSVAWVTMAGALVQSERARGATRAFVRQTTLSHLRGVLADEGQTPERRLEVVAQVAGARVRELEAPDGRRRAIVFSAVLVRRAGRWLFHTTHWAIAAE